MGATWNPSVIEACGHALGKETNMRGVDVLLGSPNVNIHRDPLNGRLFEGYSEDPCLASKLAPSLVKGVQEEGVIANVKHFAANNQETDRMGVDEHISERALREIYLPGFQACVRAGCKTVMSAYKMCIRDRYQLIYQFKMEGKAIIMISEELPELIGMSDRMIIMKEGRITGEFTRSKEVTDTKLIEYMV